MAAPDSKTRMKDAVTLFNYGFGKCQRYEEKQIQPMEPVEVSRGKEKQVNVVQDGKFVYVDTTGADLSKVKRKAVYKEKIEAPVKKGEKIGVVQYYLDEKMIGSIDIIAEQSVEKISYKSAMGNALEEFLL